MTKHLLVFGYGMFKVYRDCFLLTDKISNSGEVRVGCVMFIYFLRSRVCFGSRCVVVRLLSSRDGDVLWLTAPVYLFVVYEYMLKLLRRVFCLQFELSIVKCSTNFLLDVFELKLSV